MFFHDDAEIEEVVKTTVDVLKGAARQIGKADRSISTEQIARIEEAFQQVHSTLDFKKKINANRA
ncbi:hypothetical protein NKI01_09020 [Mesorhizobium sp. M0815]|uniref:hypothetical protein n=1 Tax=Mesorhizobium sp. M0815 TaxID=2957005 RepID=UPI00333D271C